MTTPAKERNWRLAQELVVPALMLACTGFYWFDARDLSAVAQAFPLALTVVLLVLLAAIVGRAGWQACRSAGPETQDEQTTAAQPADGALVAVKRWAIVLLPVVLIFFWRQIGAAATIFFYSLFVLVLLGERRPLWLAAIPTVLALGLTYLFKTVLYLRLPDAAWLPGNWL